MQYKISIANKHKSRQISAISISCMTINQPEFELDKLDSRELILETCELTISGFFSYKVESKTKSSRSKKLKFEKFVNIFEQSGSWKLDDDALVDLLHEKYFQNNIELKIPTTCTSLEDIIAAFNGAYLVHKADNGASICGQLGEDSDFSRKILFFSLKCFREERLLSEIIRRKIDNLNFFQKSMANWKWSIGNAA